MLSQVPLRCRRSRDDIGMGIAPGFIPLISGNWNTFFTGDLAWDGTGTIPDDTKAALQDIVAQVHGEDKILRFWNLPQDAPSVWGRSTMPTST